MATFLSPQGYSVLKNSVSPEDIEETKKELTVVANVPQDFNMGTQTPFKLYQEGPNKLYVPKFFGINKFGAPDVVKLGAGITSINVGFKGLLRKEQEEPIAKFLETARHPVQSGGILNLTCASGKCLGYGTPILMFNGEIKHVQDIQVGDLLMGDDNNPREVLSTCRGHDKLYRIKQQYGIDYTVNASHILTLMKDNRLVDINVQDYMTHPERHSFYGVKRSSIFPEKCVEIHPYLLGYVYGAFKSIDINIPCKKHVRNLFKSAGIVIEDNELDVSFSISKHTLLQDFYDTYRYEQIPLNYKANDPNVMLDFLAGFVDVAAHYICCHNLIFRFLPTQNKLMEDIKFMCRALGFDFNLVDTKKGTIFAISGYLASIPSKIYRLESCKQRSLQFVYPIQVEEIDCGDYYGFEINGNRRFLLGDFTVTHNTVMAIYLICELRVKSLVVVHKDFLLEQWKERIQQFAPDARLGLIKAKTVDVHDKDIVLASLQSLSMKDYEKSIFDGFGFAIVDECHHTSAEVFSKALKKICFKYTLGLSATIKRKDGLSKVFKWYLGDVIYSNVKKKTKDHVNVLTKYYYVPDPLYSKEEFMMGKKLNISKMINNICSYPPRVRLISQCIMDVLTKEPGRKIIVLSDRRSHLETIGADLARYDLDCGYYLGGMRQGDLKASEEKQILLGTFCMVSEGFDCKSLDTLVIASPKSDVIQSVGRILREEACKRRHTPLVVDIIDNFSIFERQGRKRLTYYKSQKYNIIGDCDPVKDNKLIRLDGPCFSTLE